MNKDLHICRGTSPYSGPTFQSDAGDNVTFTNQCYFSQGHSDWEIISLVGTGRSLR